ncbi:MAG: J domain-containing protein [Candidatus Omnitrophica bacterium]|nr:J domain-containing protein [Candidatus Omnitrophota bacterium]
MKFKFEELNRARKILGLDEEATLYEVRNNYYELSKKFHPDRCKGNKKECEEKFKEITQAYNLIMEYIACFRISFKEKDVERMSIDKVTYKHLKQFYDGWWENLDY